ncbi:unnamed protein product [Malus baccata var. baccata]
MSAAEVSTPDDRGGENINAMRALYPGLIYDIQAIWNSSAPKANPPSFYQILKQELQALSIASPGDINFLADFKCVPRGIQMVSFYPSQNKLINSHLIKSHSLRGLGKQFPSLEAWYGMMESAQEGEGTTEEAKKSNVARKLEKHQQVRMLNPRLKDSLGAHLGRQGT